MDSSIQRKYDVIMKEKVEDGDRLRRLKLDNEEE
jgi:hypothetical protein